MPTTLLCAQPARCDSPIRVEDHQKWARAIARGIRRVFGFASGSQEELDLEAVAQLTMCRLAVVFDHHRVPAGGDPAGQFRGWVHPWVRSEVVREARRLRNAGTYWTRNESEIGEDGLKRRRAPIIANSLPHGCHEETGSATQMGAELETDGRRSSAPEAIDLVIAKEEAIPTCLAARKETAPPRRKRRWNTRTGEEITDPPLPRLSYLG